MIRLLAGSMYRQLFVSCHEMLNVLSAPCAASSMAEAVCALAVVLEKLS